MAIIRTIRLEDSQAIQAINEKSLGYAYPLEKTTRRIKEILLDESQIFLLAEVDGQVIGYVQAQYYLCSYLDPMYNVLALAVSEEFQHQGLGKQLMKALEVEAQKLGVSIIRLNSMESRAQAHQFYQGIGFKESDYLQKRFIKNIDKT